MFTTSLSATPVGLAKLDLLLELLDLLLALPSIPPPRYLSAVSTAQSTLHLSCAGLQTIFVCLLTPEPISLVLVELVRLSCTHKMVSYSRLCQLLIDTISARWIEIE